MQDGGGATRGKRSRGGLDKEGEETNMMIRRCVYHGWGDRNGEQTERREGETKKERKNTFKAPNERMRRKNRNTGKGERKKMKEEGREKDKLRGLSDKPVIDGVRQPKGKTQCKKRRKKE